MAPTKEERTFETRLLFLKEIFSELYSQDIIMTSCIQHKLTNSYMEYLKDVHKSLWVLLQKNPISVLKKIDS